MEQKTKIIIIAVGAFLLICLIALFVANGALTNQNKALKEDKEALAKQNDTLGAKIEQERREKKDLQSKLEEMKRVLDQAEAIRRDRDELQKKYEQVSQEREKILKELTQQKGKAVAIERPQALPQSAAGDEAYWSAVLKAKADLEVMVAKLKEQATIFKNKAEALQKEKASLQLDIDNLSNDKNELSQKLAYNEKMIDLLSVDLVREKKDKRKIQDNFNTIREENEVLKRDMKVVNKQKIDLEVRLQKIDSEKQNLERRVLAVNETLDDKASEILDIREKLEDIKKDSGITSPKSGGSVELPEIVVRSQDPMAAESRVAGKVLEVNPDSNFVIIDVGEDSGVRRGMTFVVYRANAQIGNIEVVQTRKSVSACDIKQAVEQIKVGDIVK